jgi:type I restriction enzyme S subunit
MSWVKKTLSELCLIEKGKIGIKKATPGEYPMVVTAEERLSHNEFHFEGNAVIIPLVSSTGHGHKSLKRIHFQSGKFAVGNILCVVIPKDENVLRADYLYRFLDLNREKELVSRMKGMANVTLPMKEIAKVEIPVPPIEAQIEFVQQYSSLEEKSHELGNEVNQQLDLIKLLRQAFLREAMQGKLVPQEPNDESASILLEKIKAEKERLIKEKIIKKQKPLPPITEDEFPYEIPENWEWCRLGALTTYGSSSKAEPSDLKSDTWVLDLEDIEKESSRLLCKIRFHERNSLSTKSKFEAGDVLYSKLRPYLDKVIVADEPGVCTTEILPLKCYAGLNPYYFKAALKRPDFLLHVNSVTRGMKMPRLGTKEGELALIPIAPISEQQRIVAKLDELMQFCDELEASIKESQGQNELLLQQVLFEALEPKEKEVEKV